MSEDQNKTVAVEVQEPSVKRPSPMASVLAFLLLCAFLLAIPFISNWAASNNDDQLSTQVEQLQR